MNTKPEHVEILKECLRRMQEHAQTPRPPEWKWWERRPYDEITTHGPEYGCGEWFGNVPECQRMRYRRAIADLERGGLLVTWSRGGRRLSHIRLTPMGEKVAREVSKQ
jgi:hypothetical protein